MKNDSNELFLKDDEIQEQVLKFAELTESSLSDDNTIGSIYSPIIKSYKSWLIMENFNKKFSITLIKLSNLIHTDKILKLTSNIRTVSAQREHKLIKDIFEITKGDTNKSEEVLEYLFKKNKEIIVTSVPITTEAESYKIANSKDNDEEKKAFRDQKKQSLIKFESLFEVVEKSCNSDGTIEGKVNFKQIIATVNSLEKRVVCSISSYKFPHFKYYQDRLFKLHDAMKLLRLLLKHWYKKKYSTSSDKTDLEIYNDFEREYLQSIPSRGAGSELGYEKAFRDFFSAITPAYVGVTKHYENAINFHSPKNNKKEYQSAVLKYNLQLWIEKKQRIYEEALPRLSESCTSKADVHASQTFLNLLSKKNEYLFKFLANGELNNRILYLKEYFVGCNSHAPILDAIFSNFPSKISKNVICQKLAECFSNFISEYESSVSNCKIRDISHLADYASTFDIEEYFKYSSLIHFLVLYSLDDETSIEELFKQSFELELTVMYRGLFLNHILEKTLKGEPEKVITEYYKEYKKTIFRLAKAWLHFINQKRALIDDDERNSVESFVNTNLRKYFRSSFLTSDYIFNNLAKNPGDFEFIEEDATGAIKRLFNAFKIELNEFRDFPITLALSDDKETFERYAKEVGQDINPKQSITPFDAVELGDFCSEAIRDFWQAKVGKFDEQIAFHAYIYDFFREENITPEYVQESTVKIRNFIAGSKLLSYVHKFKSSGLNDIFLDFDDSMSIGLAEKLEVAKQVINLEDNRYRLVNDEFGQPIKLGYGGFGCVYKAKDLKLDAIVAIKLIPHWADSQLLEKKMLNEAVIMRKCRHLNVVTLHDVYTFSTEFMQIKTEVDSKLVQSFRNDNYINALVMDYVDNAQTLRDFVESKTFKSYSYKEKLDLFLSICNGVEQAHNLSPSVVHGDLKPENILIDKNNTPKVTDFGISSVVGELPKGSSGILFSSSRVLNKQPATVQDDIHSLGMILIYILYPKLKAVISENILLDSKEIKNKLVAFLYMLKQDIFDICLDEYEQKFIDKKKLINTLVNKIPLELSVFKSAVEEIINSEVKLNSYTSWPLETIVNALSEGKEQHEYILEQSWLKNDCELADLKRVQKQLKNTSKVSSFLEALGEKLGYTGNLSRFYIPATYENIGRFIFDIGLCKEGSELKISKYLNVAGVPFNRLVMNRLPEKHLLEIVRDEEFDINLFHIFCHVKTSDKENKLFIASNGGSTAYKLIIEDGLLKSDFSQLHRHFYAPCKSIIEDIKRASKDGVSAPWLRKFNTKLWGSSGNEQFNHDSYPFKIKTLRYPNLAEYVGCIEDHYYTYSSSINALMLSLDNVFEELLSTPEFEALHFLNTLPHEQLYAISKCLNKSDTKEQFEKMMADFKIPQAVKHHYMLNGEETLQYNDVGKISHAIFSSKSSLLRGFIKQKRRLEKWELINFAQSYCLLSDLLQRVELVIEEYITSNDFRLLKEDIDQIESFFESNPKEQVINECLRVSDEVELL